MKTRVHLSAETGKLYLIPPYIPCPHCGVRRTLVEAMGIAHSDQTCPTCKNPLTVQDVGRYCGVIDNVAL